MADPVATGWDGFEREAAQRIGHDMTTSATIGRELDDRPGQGCFADAVGDGAADGLRTCGRRRKEKPCERQEASQDHGPHIDVA